MVADQVPMEVEAHLQGVFAAEAIGKVVDDLVASYVTALWPDEVLTAQAG